MPRPGWQPTTKSALWTAAAQLPLSLLCALCVLSGLCVNSFFFIPLTLSSNPHSPLLAFSWPPRPPLSASASPAPLACCVPPPAERVPPQTNSCRSPPPGSEAPAPQACHLSALHQSSSSHTHVRAAPSPPYSACSAPFFATSPPSAASTPSTLPAPPPAKSRSSPAAPPACAGST